MNALNDKHPGLILLLFLFLMLCVVGGMDYQDADWGG